MSLLGERLAPLGVRVGTVDKFQGQEAPVVIYSMAASRPEDAPLREGVIPLAGSPLDSAVEGSSSLTVSPVT